jgi:hypothetical protein
MQSQYIRAGKECCAMGMRLASIHTKEEQECIYSLFAGKIYHCCNLINRIYHNNYLCKLLDNESI